MKRLSTFLCILGLLLTPTAIFAEQFRIAEVFYNIDGMTKQYAVELAIEISTKRIFHSQEEFDSYIDDLRQRFTNERVFESSSISVEEIGEEDGITLMSLLVETKDSRHFIGVPYFKYDSNDGATFKIKMKDVNFLGTMETLNFDLNYKYEEQDDGSYDNIFGVNFSYDYPFKLWKLASSWNNLLSLDFTLGESEPEFDISTGFTFTMPFDRYSLVLDLSQSITQDFDYEKYDDKLYFTEAAKFSIPIIAAEIDNWGDVIWTPYIAYEYKWDKNGINKKNEDLRGPTLSVGHSIATKRVDWIENFRQGLSLEFGQSVTYNYYTEKYTPKVWAEWTGFKAYKYAGINARLYGFAQFNGDTSIGSRLRGIKDKQDYSNLTDKDGDDVSAVDVPVALVGNLDLPIHIITTDWNGWTEAIFGEDSTIASKLHWMRVFDFELQLALFADFALTKNKETERLFSIKDGFYSGGVEAIIFPARWRSLEIRASLGIDAGRKIIKKVVPSLIDDEWRSQVSAWEAYIGIGLHY